MSAVARVLAVEGAPDFVRSVETELRRAVSAHEGTVADAGQQTLRAGGKRLRPLLTYLCSPAEGRGRPELVTAGCAVELIHMATLVHDDQLDRAPLRRGLPTVWSEHGDTVTSATGDYLFSRAFAELVTTGDMLAVSLLADACHSLARGEILQRAQAGDPAVTPEQYLERCRLKTGELFSAAARLGGRFGGLDAPELELLGEFALELGLAFQIADDILDCDGDPDTTGKPLGTDLLDGTVTLPLLIAARKDAEVAAVIARGADAGRRAADACPGRPLWGCARRPREAKPRAVPKAPSSAWIGWSTASTRRRCATWWRQRLIVARSTDPAL